MALMVVYHVCWDLTYFRLVEWPLLTDWRWLAFRTVIAGSFLAIAGASLTLAAGGYGAAARRRGDGAASGGPAHGRRTDGESAAAAAPPAPDEAAGPDRAAGTRATDAAPAEAPRGRPEAGLNWRRWARRLAVLAAAAGAISLATWIAFPTSWIFFGILHHLAAASLLGLAFVRLRGPWAAATILAALFAFTARDWLAGPAFDRPGLQWLGLMTYSPQSNDYVPLFPWFGYFLSGLAAARLALDYAPRLLAAAEPSAAARSTAILRWTGRNSLAIYLLHQPVLMGGIVVVTRLAETLG